MHILKIILQGVGETVMLRFKKKDDATTCRNQIQDAMQTKDGAYPRPVDTEDDFGLSVKIPPYGVLLMQLIDFEKAAEGDAIWHYNQKKIQERVINRLMAEQPIIRNASK